MRAAVSAAVLAFASLATAGGCKPKATATPEPEPRSAAEVIVEGRASFEAHFRSHFRERVLSESEVPSGHAPFRHVRICLIRARGAQDLRTFEHLLNDQPLGCVTTDANGWYRFRVPKCEKQDCVRRYYLATDFCVLGGGRPQACVQANAPMGRAVRYTNWEEAMPHRKFMWTDTTELDLSRQRTLFSWNLSCPHQPGFLREDVSCDSEVRAGWWGRANSNYGHNVAAIHAAVAAAQPIVKFGSLIPSDRNTLAPAQQYCGGPRDKLSKKGWLCQDAIRIVISDLRGAPREERPCKSRKSNYFQDARTVCMRSPTNPFILAHEMGHVAHVRFLNYAGGLTGSAAKMNWTQGREQKAALSEGWANFFAAATWYPADANQPTFDTYPAEPANDPSLQGTCGQRTVLGEGRTTQFFWDLFDPPRASEPWDDVSVDLATLLEVWSLFRGRHGKYAKDRHRGECDPHGRNAWDFKYWYDRHPSGLPNADQIMRENCMDRQVRTMACQ